MANVNVIDGSKKVKKTIEIGDEFLAKEVNKAVLYESVKHFLAGQHHGTVKTQNRGEVSRSGKKIFRQKGTGNARHGSRKPAPFVGGGRVFGPRPRNYSYHLPKKVKRKAIAEAVKDHLLEGSLTVIDSFSFSEPKTKVAKEFFKNINVDSALVVIDEKNDIVEKSIRNLVGFKVVSISGLSAYLMLKYENVVFTEAAFEKVKENYLN